MRTFAEPSAADLRFISEYSLGMALQPRLYTVRLDERTRKWTNERANRLTKLRRTTARYQRR